MSPSNWNYRLPSSTFADVFMLSTTPEVYYLTAGQTTVNVQQPEAPPAVDPVVQIVMTKPALERLYRLLRSVIEEVK